MVLSIKLIIVSLFITILTHSCLSNINTKNYTVRQQKVFVDKAGAILFNKNCKNCHVITKTDFVLSSSFISIDVEYLYLYLTKEDSLVNAKDPYTLALNEKWQEPDYMHNFQLSKSEILAIKMFIISLNER